MRNWASQPSFSALDKCKPSIDGGPRQGFTIVELLIVIVVIAILIAIVTVSYSGVQNRANDTTVKSDLLNIAKQINVFNALNGRYPQGSSDLAGMSIHVGKGSYAPGYYSGTGYYNMLYCWPGVASPDQFALVAQSKSGTVFQYAGGTVTQVAYSLGTGVTTCANAGVTLDANGNRDWFYDFTNWQTYIK